MKKIAFLLLVFANLLSLQILAAPQFICPMKCEGEKTYASAGSCPVCKMDMVPLGAAPKEEFKPPTLRVMINTVPATVEARKPAKLVWKFFDTQTSKPVSDFDVQHEKQLHLVGVSEDLSWFIHEHPTLNSNTQSWELSQSFPSGGSYEFFADIKPKGALPQILTSTIQVGGAKSPNKPLKADLKPKKVGSFQVAIKPSQDLKHAQPLSLSYEITQNGKVVKDLEPYLGASAHSMLVSEGQRRFIHLHPEGAHHVVAPVKGAMRFAVNFASPGLYKNWFQFKHQGKILTADFVLSVE